MEKRNDDWTFKCGQKTRHVGSSHWVGVGSLHESDSPHPVSQCFWEETAKCKGDHSSDTISLGQTLFPAIHMLSNGSIRRTRMRSRVWGSKKDFCETLRTFVGLTRNACQTRPPDWCVDCEQTESQTTRRFSLRRLGVVGFGEIFKNLEIYWS